MTWFYAYYHPISPQPQYNFLHTAFLCCLKESLAYYKLYSLCLLLWCKFGLQGRADPDSWGTLGSSKWTGGQSIMSHEVESAPFFLRWDCSPWSVLRWETGSSLACRDCWLSVLVVWLQIVLQEWMARLQRWMTVCLASWDLRSCLGFKKCEGRTPS